MIKVTVCEVHDDSEGFAADWDALVEHVKAENSDFVLLPEMPFSPWLAWTDQADEGQWAAAVRTHEHWMERLDELSPATVLTSRPVIDGGVNYHEGFVWERDGNYQGVHRKVYLPDEPGFWEATWYRPGEMDFQIAEVSGVKMGFLLCTEMWFTQHAQDYAKQGIHLLLTPRATMLQTAEKWIMGGRAAAVMAGAYSLSSNRTGTHNGVEFGGHAWIIDPEGEVLGVSSAENPFLTREIDPGLAEDAKRTYPRYVYVQDVGHISD